MSTGMMVSALGLLLLAWYAVMFAAPAKAMDLLRKFPRNRLAGIALTAIALIWAAVLLYKMPLGWFDNYKQWLYLLTPLGFLLIVVFMDELLAPRALGALLLLIPAPILHGIRFHDSSLRLVVVVVCYLMVIKGIMFVMSPYELRKKVEYVIRTESKCRLIGIVGLVIGLFLLVSGLTVFSALS